MARDVSHIIEVTGELTCTSPVHIGDWRDGPGNSLPVQRDGQYRLLIPGTSIAGALRSWLATVTTAAGPFDTSQLFGHIVPRTQNGEASLIQVDDAVAGPETAVRYRDGVAIDRVTGAAAHRLLYGREVAPPGTRFSFRLAGHEPRAGGARVREAIDCLVGALATGRVTVGARRSAGLGRVQLHDAVIRAGNQATRAGMVAWLSRAEPGQPASPAGDPLADSSLRITVEWSAQTPVMVQDSAQGAIIDSLPLAGLVPGTEREHPELAWLLPGSAVKGALRTHAERIVRTVRGIDPAGPFLDVIQDPGLGPALTLFGLAGDRSGVGAGTNGQPGSAKTGRQVTGWRGTLDVADCHARTRFRDAAWQAAITAHAQSGDPVDDLAALRAALANLPETARPRISHHVAVDRWTGGAAENLLFSALEPAQADWEDLHLTLDTGRCRDDPLALPLLLLLLRDLADGWLSLGFGGTRGLGAIKVTRISFAGDGLPPRWAALAGRTLEDLIDSPPPEVTEAFAAWQDYAGPVGVTA